MKVLKFKHELAQLIAQGKRTSTWRINDEKNLTVNDKVEVVDKVNRTNPESWQVIGTLRINQIIQKRLGEVSEHDLSEQDDYSTRQEVLKALRGHYGSKINKDTPVKIIKFDFTAQEPTPYAVNNNPDSQFAELKLYADGGSRGNPGPSASGYVLMDMDNAVIAEGGLFLGVTTNNQAEYRALKIGLEEAKKRSTLVVHVYMDSLLVINQMKGSYKIKNADLLPVYQEIKILASTFRQVSYTHVPREYNKLADAMVNEVLDSEPIDSR